MSKSTNPARDEFPIPAELYAADLTAELTDAELEDIAGGMSKTGGNGNGNGNGDGRGPGRRPGHHRPHRPRFPR